MKEEILAEDAFKGSFFQDGIAVIDLSDLAGDNDDENSQNSHQNIAGPIFDQFRAALPQLRSDVALHIPADASEAHSVTGFHTAGVHAWSARSNVRREGIVVSNGGAGANCLDEGCLTHGLDLQPLVQLLHRVANHVLRIIEEQLELPSGWFDEHMMGGGGGGGATTTSQFHLKSYVWPQHPGEHDGSTPRQQSVSTSTNDDLLEPPTTLLPSHTDPSLISVVLLDRPGHQPGSQGLEYCTTGGQWKETSHSGHDSAIVLVGSALSYMTGGYLHAPRHRVRCHLVAGREEQVHHHRFAATLFVRPSGSAILRVPPSPALTHVTLKRNWTFEQWNARISKNYRKPKQPQLQCDGRRKDTTHGGRVVVFRDECTELALWPCPVAGREKFLGGELSIRNGKIYTIPGHAPRVMVIDAPSLERDATSDGDPDPSHHPNGSSSSSASRMYCIGPEFDGEYKWLRGVSMPNGLIVGIPCHAGAVLCIDPDADPEVFTVTWDESDPLAPSQDLPWKWHGGQVSPFDGCLYCIPQRAETVLKFDPIAMTATFLGGPFPGRNKWYGGLLGRDGAIYGVTQNHPSVLRIDPTNQTATLHGHFPEGGHKWHGGVLGPDGNIYGIPANADCVLKIEPGPIPRIGTIGGPLRSGHHRTDGKYKYLGGAVGVDGNVYLFPSDSDSVLQIEIAITGVCREVGPDLRALEAMQHNKWQNGFASGDFLYGIPLKGNSVIRMRLRNDGREPDVTTLGGGSPCLVGLNKWEGGVMSASGVMYCVPLNHSHVLQIRPRGVVAT